jgi:hypothetical protein
MRISNSFSEGEVQVLDFMLNTLLRGGTPHMATRHKDFASLYRKVLSMKKRMEDQEKKRQATERSSVGTIDAPDTEETEANKEAV